MKNKKSKFKNKIPERLVTLLSLLPLQRNNDGRQGEIFLYFVIMVRNSQNFSPWLFIEMMVR